MIRRASVLPIVVVIVSALLALGAAGSARAEAITTLIAEKAAETFGYALPAHSEFNVSMRNPEPGEAQFISDFWMDRDTGQFIANAVTKSGETRRVSGLAALMIPVPVPTRRIMPDTILTKQDFQIVSLPYARVGAYAVTSLDHLVGQQVRRMLSPGRPVMSQSVAPPLVIDRGDRVSIRYSKGPMTLSAPGRAITSAQADQEVRVINLASNKTVTGIARTSGIVEIVK
ncbi:flagellar basal body P-ring formation chaperone FlgA [Acidimangrovimonas pyrenivorans]|uniref:Flagella basal body P-ring formation protein FlgA n=1 Tax=Acidimangrovimonas pyrenivorans TaxID=2030798 RepID=A0ABV7ANE9_9RHOB